MIYARIVGTGSYLPPRIVRNEEFSARLDTSDAWIRERTGIVQRHIADRSRTAFGRAPESPLAQSTSPLHSNTYQPVDSRRSAPRAGATAAVPSVLASTTTRRSTLAPSSAAPKDLGEVVGVVVGREHDDCCEGRAMSRHGYDCGRRYTPTTTKETPRRSRVVST
jgi:hypothetical protein